MRVLGISPAHDSSVASYCDGEIEFYCKEERYSRVKRDKSPFLSIQKIKENLKEPVDSICLAGITSGEYTTAIIDMSIKLFETKDVYDMTDSHHLCHASLAFYNSGFSEAAVIVADRNGTTFKKIANESETVFVASYPNNFIEIYKNYWVFHTGNDLSSKIYIEFENLKKEKPDCEIVYNSCFGITKVYETATVLIGQDILENGKTMGLSAYGKDNERFPSLFRGPFPIDNYFSHINGNSVFFDLIGKECKTVDENNYHLYADYAYQIQKQTQIQMCTLIDNTIKKTGLKNICISGGFGLNVVANGFYTKMFPNINFYFEPMSDDSGNSIGSAMFVYREKTKDNKISPIKTTFFHGMLSDLSGIDGVDCEYSDVVNLILNQKSVAIYNGLAEAGPRALGNRSILFDARNKDAKAIVNLIKKREWYRPFAAAVLEEDSSRYFTMTTKDSPYMTISFATMDDVRDVIPGVVHVDGSCRVQTVSPDNEHLYNILKIFKEKTGHGILLNTSFNLAGEPLVESPEEALSILKRSTLDAVWFPEISKVVLK